MEITKRQQELLAQKAVVREVAKLIEENQGDSMVLGRASQLAVAVFGLLSSIDGDECSVGFALQDYAYNSLQASRGDSGAEAWLDENSKTLRGAIKVKFR